MELGNQLVNLRKTKGLSQEELAHQLGVTRQTISKWELGETAPDIREAKELSKIFHISLDELVGNDTKNIIIEKVSNTEKLAGMLIKIIKWFGISISVLFSIEIVVFIILVIIRITHGG